MLKSNVCASSDSFQPKTAQKVINAYHVEMWNKTSNSSTEPTFDFVAVDKVTNTSK